MVVRGDLHQPIALELGQSAVDGGTIDVAEPEFDEPWHQAVSVPRLLGQQEKDRRQHEPTGWRQLEARHTLGCRRPPGTLLPWPCTEILVPQARSVNGRTVGLSPQWTVQKTLIYSGRHEADTSCSRTTPRGHDRGGHIDGD